MQVPTEPAHDRVDTLVLSAKLPFGAPTVVYDLPCWMYSQKLQLAEHSTFGAPGVPTSDMPQVCLQNSMSAMLQLAEM